MAYANNITQLVQQAGALYLDGQALTEISNIYEGLQNVDKQFPCVVVLCKRAEAEEVYDGNWSADLVIRVESQASDTTETQHHARAGEVFSKFMGDASTLETDLSGSLTGFTAIKIYPRLQVWDLVTQDESQYWVSEIRLTVKCCGSDVA